MRELDAKTWTKGPKMSGLADKPAVTDEIHSANSENVLSSY